ncbi:hypothetical protein B0J14DRAFT_561659 [Halenospora varia]|nr:hypothetical protein B0J14DRAFT_561659 [Halenospora varia]
MPMIGQIEVEFAKLGTELANYTIGEWVGAARHVREVIWSFAKNAARGNIKTRKGEGDALFIILSMIEELKSSNEEIKTSGTQGRTSRDQSPTSRDQSTTSRDSIECKLWFEIRGINGPIPAAILRLRLSPHKINQSIIIIREEERSKAQPEAIRKAIEEEIRTMDGHMNWRCAAVIRDASGFNWELPDERTQSFAVSTNILGAANYDTVDDLDQREAKEEETQLGARFIIRAEENKWRSLVHF